jgi:hypothetical protein
MAINRGRKSSAISIAAPVGGLNDRDSIADMGSEYAIQLDNWFPGTRSVSVRGGSVLHASGLPATGETLMAYQGIYASSSVNRLFAAADDSIYDITAGGVITSAAVTGKSNARWDYVNFANNGASYLVCVNGSDLPMFYNGNTWTASSTGYATPITGVTASTFTQVAVWKNRLFFVQKNSLSCWYLGTGAIGGAASELNFGGVAKLGGHLVAITTLTSSAGVTPDDYLVAITSEGECLVYRGTDPADPNKFGLVGVFRIGRPIANGSNMQGGRFISRIGADVVVITADGMVTLQSMMNFDVLSQQKTINDTIINTVTQSVTKYKSNFGWQAKLCPMQNKLIINVPTAEGSQSFQYVMNTITGAWCRFLGWSATCFEIFQDSIYSIIGDNVYIMDIQNANDFMSSTSQGSPVYAAVKTAFVYAGGRGQQKQYTLARPLLISAGSLSPLININTNLMDEPISGEVDVSSGIVSARWDYSKWQPASSPAKWGDSNIQFQDWVTVNGIGYCVALKMQVQLDTNKCDWQGWELQFMKGGLI